MNGFSTGILSKYMWKTKPPWIASSTGTLSKYMSKTEPAWTASVLAHYKCMSKTGPPWTVCSTGTLSKLDDENWAFMYWHIARAWVKLGIHELFAVLAHYPSRWWKLSLHVLAHCKSMSKTGHPWTVCSTGTLSKLDDENWAFMYWHIARAWVKLGIHELFAVLAHYPSRWCKLSLHVLAHCKSMSKTGHPWTVCSTGTLSKLDDENWAFMYWHIARAWVKLGIHELFAVLAHYPSTWGKLSVHELFQYWHITSAWVKLCLHELPAVLAHYPSTWVKLCLHGKYCLSRRVSSVILQYLWFYTYFNY
jgi:calcineurin-like phosphoesterase family protein